MDKKRLPVPEITVPVASLPRINAPKKTPVVNATADGKRADGRQPDDVRPVFLKPGLISRAEGSAYLEMDRIKIAAAIYGPRSTDRNTEFSQIGHLHCDFKFATFASAKRRGFQRDAQEKEFSSVLAQALSPCVQLERYPKSTIDVYITVLESDGTFASLAAAVTCASLALADAGIEMRDMVTAASMMITDERLVLDPTEREESTMPGGTLLLACMPSINEITHLVEQGDVNLSLMSEAVERSMENCSKLYAALQSCLVEAAKKRNKKRKA